MLSNNSSLLFFLDESYDIIGVYYLDIKDFPYNQSAVAEWINWALRDAIYNQGFGVALFGFPTSLISPHINLIYIFLLLLGLILFIFKEEQAFLNDRCEHDD